MAEEFKEGYIRSDEYNDEKIERIANMYSNIITDLGEDVNREGLLKTPERVAKAMQYLTHGYDLDPAEILKSAMFTEDHNQMVHCKGH